MSDYYAFSLSYPDIPPYDHKDHKWPSFIGEIIRPFAELYPEILYWAACYGTTVEFKAYTDNKLSLHRFLQPVRQAGFVANRLNRTLEEDLGGGRFRGPQSTSTPTNRALLILRSLKAVCDLVVDSVYKKDDGYWAFEVNADKRLRAYPKTPVALRQMKAHAKCNNCR